MGNVPSLKNGGRPADPVTWWLEEVEALRNEYAKRARTSGPSLRVKNSSEVFF